MPPSRRCSAEGFSAPISGTARDLTSPDMRTHIGRGTVWSWTRGAGDWFGLSRPTDQEWGTVTMSEPQIERRRFLGGAAVAGAALAAVGVTGSAQAAPPAGPARGPGAPARSAGSGQAGNRATFRWLGTAGWRIDLGAKTILIDPYLSRYDTGLFRGAFNPQTQLTVATAAVDAYAGRPETILVTHSHWDHINDVPYLATGTGARVVGTLTTYHLALAGGVPVGQLAPVSGGELLDFGDYTVEVVSSLHSRNASYSMAFPGVRVSQPPPPVTIADLPEGDTLAFQLQIKDGPAVFFMGASDFVERNLTGLAPDVAMIALPSSNATHDYVPG